MSSVLETEKETSSSEAFLVMFRKRFCRRLMLDLCDGDATVREKSFTYETMMPVGMRRRRGARYIRQRRGERGEPWGVATETGAGMLGAPWKPRVHLLPMRKEETQSTIYEGMILERRRARSFVALTLSNPAMMSRKRVDTFRRRPLKGSDFAGKGGHCVTGAEAREGATLVWVKQAGLSR